MRWGQTVVGLVVLVATAWGCLALWFQLPHQFSAPGLAVLAAWGLLGAISAFTLFWRYQARYRRSLLGAYMLSAALLLVWWYNISPSHQRDWADDVANLLQAEIQGDQVTLHNVRNFEWRTETDYTPNWETRSYDLNQLVSADLVLSYWMGPHIAHTLVSFGFADDQQLVFSLEIRKERHESFSAIGGFFRQFEQVLIAADERDLIRTRSNARGEDVYLYRLAIPPEQLRTLFLGYLQAAEALRTKPDFYNSLTSNCTTIVFDLARHIAPGLPLDYRLVLSGHFAEYAYDLGALVPEHSYTQLQQLGYINARAQSSDTNDKHDFSRLIRLGVPGASDKNTL
ncbi:Lnb N-terminal periplasmic domain-containing protein [Rheinheimera sp. EpRS3]|uniref:Lnb N-terminal periplasmic domain-containing protein n=1 Tax=Rheinheimera sp. EpRS3 TaxID=1712383 RepID=UPI0007490D7E|nr:DUF4105 domain-containing protein [Rheinheimera sp. EpRS3]KUM52590.1 hypothetical protein AR688_09890 [Rheinheimera sp. EpRS3]